MRKLTQLVGLVTGIVIPCSLFSSTFSFTISYVAIRNAMGHGQLDMHQCMVGCGMCLAITLFSQSCWRTHRWCLLCEHWQVVYTSSLLHHWIHQWASYWVHGLVNDLTAHLIWTTWSFAQVGSLRMAEPGHLQHIAGYEHGAWCLNNQWGSTRLQYHVLQVEIWVSHCRQWALFQCKTGQQGDLMHKYYLETVFVTQ